MRFNPILPYFAVLRTDFGQTLQSWVFRLWVIVTLITAVGYWLYKFGIHREVGLVQSASEQTGILLRTIGLVTLAFVSLISIVAVGGERGTVADSILSRGISRHQYFLAKWHSRTAVLLGMFSVLSLVVLLAYHFLLEPDVTFSGGIAATLLAMAMLAAVVAWGVTIGALSNGTVIGITIFWLVLFGSLFLMSYLPEPFPSPGYMLAQLRSILRGNYDALHVVKVMAIFLGIAIVGGTVGLVGYSRKDV